MPCYPCGHCNACGLFSLKLEITCATCGADVVTGQSSCPNCGSPYANNIIRGKMGKPKGANDYYTKIDESKGIDAHALVEMASVDLRSPMPGKQPKRKAAGIPVGR